MNTYVKLFNFIKRRRNSNRHKKAFAKSGKKTTTRTVHALTRVHGPRITKNPVILKLVRRSAERRLKRLRVEGRKPMKYIKREDPCQQVDVGINVADASAAVVVCGDASGEYEPETATNHPKAKTQAPRARTASRLKASSLQKHKKNARALRVEFLTKHTKK